MDATLPRNIYPVMVHNGTVSLDCDDEILRVSSPQASDDSMFLNPALMANPSPTHNEESHSPSTSEVPPGTRKRKRVSDPKKSSLLDDALSVLKSCASEPVKADMPYACGIMVQNTFRMNPENQYVELAMRLTAFLGKVQEEVRIKNKE